MSGDVAKARARGRKWVVANPQQSREWRAANREVSDAMIKAWVKNNPEKRRAHNTVNNALRDGKIVRPEACQSCGDRPAPNVRGASRIEAHHDDYSQPLDVAWLCKPCHKAIHRKGSDG